MSVSSGDQNPDDSSDEQQRLSTIYTYAALRVFILFLDVHAGPVHLQTIKLFADAETFRIMGKEHALVISNHKSDIDWLVGWVLAQRSGCLGSSLAAMKKSSKFLPVIGWSMWFSEYLFLERSWVKDETTLKLGLQRLRDYPQPFWLALFVEGTRFTQAKLLAAQKAAFMCGREPNFELAEKDKQELRKFKWDECLAMTHSSITNKKLRRRRSGAGPLKKSEPPMQDSDWEGEEGVNDFSASEDVESGTSVS